MVVVHGNAECRATRRALRWMDERGVLFGFIDVHFGQIEAAILKDWIDVFGWPMLIDKRTAAWRRLPPDVKQSLDYQGACALLFRQPHMLKIPIIRAGNIWLLGWNAPNKVRLLGQVTHFNNAPEHLQGRSINPR